MRVNPYAPPSSVTDPGEFCDSIHLTYSLNWFDFRRAEAQYLLHRHPIRLLTISLLMIAASTVMMLKNTSNPQMFLVSFIGSLVVSTGIYLACTFTSRLRLRKSLAQRGVGSPGEFDFVSDTEGVQISGSDGTHCWNNEVVRGYRANLGVLLVPEPDVYIYVPRRVVVVNAPQNPKQLLLARYGNSKTEHQA